MQPTPNPARDVTIGSLSKQEQLQRKILSLHQQNDKLRRENESLRQELARAKQIILQLQFLVRQHI